MRNLLLGAAAAALMSTVAVADPGGGHGGGQGKGNGGAAAHGAGGGGHGPEMKVAKADNGPAMKAEKSHGGGNDHVAKGPQMKADHGPVAKADHGKPDNPGKWDKPGKSDNGPGPRGLAGGDDGAAKAKGWKVADSRDVVRWTSFASDRGLINGCPPGLAKKDNGCMPPGLAKDRSYYDRTDWWNLGQRLDGDWRYYDGSLIRLGDDGRILGYRPLLGGSLLPGGIWPSNYGPVELPSYYQSYYGLGPADSYRYYDNTLYRVDPGTMVISSIAALLTGNDISVGQPMPLGYDVYNVPYPYRDRYVDGPDSYYRYSDGYVYQVDPTTQLVQAAIQLLT